jgi:hypothetical protein
MNSNKIVSEAHLFTVGLANDMGVPKRLVTSYYDEVANIYTEPLNVILLVIVAAMVLAAVIIVGAVINKPQQQLIK